MKNSQALPIFAKGYYAGTNPTDEQIQSFCDGVRWAKNGGSDIDLNAEVNEITISVIQAIINAENGVKIAET